MTDNDLPIVEQWSRLLDCDANRSFIQVAKWLLAEREEVARLQEQNASMLFAERTMNETMLTIEADRKRMQRRIQELCADE
jgi:hypothetical protein